jgi:D-glycero-alpha-D-manno-heptose-7-phosphate kinase
MARLAGELRDALTVNDLDGFGEVLHEGWVEKKKLASGITNPEIDEWYETARRNGAIGGKLLGAGGGGFLLLYAHPEHFTDILRALPYLQPVPVRMEPQGSKIIYVEESGMCE